MLVLRYRVILLCWENLAGGEQALSVVAVGARLQIRNDGDATTASNLDLCWAALVRRTGSSARDSDRTILQ